MSATGCSLQPFPAAALGTLPMEGFHDDQSACPQSEQHPDYVSDSLEDAISDEDVAPTRLSLASASEKKDKDNRMVGHNESAVWDEVLEEADELAYVHKDTPTVSFLSAGTSKRSKYERKLRFSIRGSSSAMSNVKTEISHIEDQEVSSGMPPTKASEALMDDLPENIDDETEDLPSEIAGPTNEANISVADLLEDLQDRSGSSVRTPFSLRQQTRIKEAEPKGSTSGKKLLGHLGQSNLDSEDPLEISSEDDDTVQNQLTMVNKDLKGQTMADLFQEAFNATDMEATAVPMRSTGAGCYGRMQQIMQMERDRNAKFLRQYNKGQDCLDDSNGITVQILSRSLEGKLTVCHCLLKEHSNKLLAVDADLVITWQMIMKFPVTSNDSSIKRTIIFSPKICENVDLVEGSIIHIYPPWKEVKVKEEEVILCTYFSHQGA